MASSILSVGLLFLFGGLLLRADASLDFCVPSSDTEKLFGQKSELCYIRDGVLNRYAMEKFTLVIPAHISTLNFYWDYRNPLYVASYELNVVYNPDPAIGKWSSSLQSHKGEIRRGLQNFTITIPCTGKAHAEIDLTIYLTIKAGKLENHYDLLLRRKKICLNGSQDETFLAPKDGFLGSLFSAADNSTRRDMTQGVNTKFLAIVGSVTVAFFIVIVAVALIVQKSKKKPSDLDMGMEINSHFGQLTSTNGHVPSLVLPEDDPLNPNGYYATSSVRDSLLRHPEQYYETSGRESVLHPPSSVYPSVFNLGPGRSVSHLNSQQLSLYETEQLTQLIEKFMTKKLIEPRLVQQTQTIIMEGTFGLIRKGTVTEQDENGETCFPEVLIKTLKEGTVTDIQTRAMLEEAILLRQAVIVNGHKNVNAVIAFSLHLSEDPQKPDIPLLLYEARGFENLKVFLGLQQTKAWISWAKSVSISMEILVGLDFLHSRNPPIVHRDVGARNCLICIGPDDNEMPRTQLTDSALARDLFPSDYECIGDNRNRPVKWLAKESLVDYVFTPASDIWSFGVLMWEICTLGETPYADVDAADMERVLSDAFRLTSPLYCPKELYECMTHCWYLRPEERPTGKRLLADLKKFHEEYTNSL